MVFKTVDGSLTTIFKKTEQISSGFNLASNEVQSFVDNFNAINSNQKFDRPWDRFLQGATNRNSNVALYFAEIAERGASARASVEGVYAAILDGNTKGFANVKSTITLFNQAQQSGSENAKAFASAVGQSNTQLGNYLGCLNGARASLVGYGTQLAITTAKTIGLRAASMALNTALSFGVSAVVSAFVSWLDKVIVTEKELAEQAKESAEKTQEQIKSLNDLKNKYIEIVDSANDEKTKNEQLNEIKQELIETYGVEKEHLENLNLERENGIELLEKEIALKSQEERGNWLGTNKKAFDKAKGKINNPDYDASTDGTIKSDIFKSINKDDVRDSVKDLFDNIYELGAAGNTYFKVAGDTLIEKYENLQKIITKLGNSKNLTQSEQNLLDGLNKESDAIKKILEEDGNQEVYETGYTFTAENYFADYVNSNKVEDVGKETYLAWRDGLIKTANGDKVLEEYLLNLAENQFPDYTEYFNNLDLAKSKFGVSGTINSATEGLKLAFINSLDDTDLDILVNKIEEPFAEGIEGAKKLIADFKADPNNKFSTFDYSSYSEQVNDIADNVDKVQSALDKLNSGKTVDNKDITKLADAFPEYSTKILAASDDTEKLKAVLTEVKTNAPRSLIDTLSNLKDLSADDQEAVNGLITILKRCGDTTAEYASTADDVSKKVKLITTAMSDMNENGYISSSTYAELQEMGGNFTECLEVQNGKLVVNIQKLKELEIQEYKNIKARKQALLDAYEKISASREAAGLGTSSISSFIDEQISNLQTEIAGYNTAINEIKTAKPDDKKKEDPASVKQFKKDNEEKKHLFEMEQITEQEYYDWLDSESQRVYGKLADYQDELWKHEEEVYKWRQEQEQKLFDKKIDNLEKFADKALDDKIEIPDVNKELEEFNKKMQSEYGLGNVDLTKRPKVAMDDGSTATVLSSSEFLWQGDEENGEYVAVHYTPILPDGTILDDDTLAKYLYETLEGSDDILKADTKGLVLKVDTGLGITDEDFNSLETDNSTQHIQDIIKACDDWDVALHNIQEQWLDVSEAAENATTTATNKFDYAREQINSAIAETQARIDGIKNGTISGDNDDIEQLTDDLDSLYDKLTDINEKEIDSQKEYIKTLKDEYSDLIDEQIDQQKKLADNIDKTFEKQIDAIDKQIDVINKVNEAEERQKDILEAQEAVKEAQRNLDKASINNRLVYTGNGGYALRSDKDAVEEAKKNLADKQAELQKAMDEQKIAVLEEQKENLETQKNNSKDYYDKVVDDLEEQKTAREKQYDLLIDIYEQLGGEKKQTSLNDSLVSKLTANGDINKAVQGLTPTEMQKAITSGILTTDSEGNYAIDYSILGENEKAVNDNTAELQKTKAELEKLNSSISGDTSNTNSSATSKVDVTKPHLDANGYLVDANGKQILNDGKPIHAKNFSEEIAKKNTNEKVSKAVSGVGKFAGYETMNDLFKAMSLGELTIPQPVADSVRNPYLNNRISENLTKAGEQVATNSNVNNNSPVINLNVTVEGSADEKTVQAMKNEIGNALISYTDKLISAIPVSSMRRQNKS